MGAINNVCFIDIETVPEKEAFTDLSQAKQSLFKHRYNSKLNKELEVRFKNPDAVHNDDIIELLSDLYLKEASLHAEFSKIVSVSIGRMMSTKFYIRTITSRHEQEILTKFAESLEKPTVEKCSLVAHNGMEFDYPFLMRRYIINAMPVPALLNVHGVKPWDYRLDDTMKMWSGTQWNYKASMELLCEVMGLPNPKDGMSGASVADIYYGSFEVPSDKLPFETEDAAINAIKKYNAGDVLSLANLFCRMKGFDLIREDQVVHIEDKPKSE